MQTLPATIKTRCYGFTVLCNIPFSGLSLQLEVRNTESWSAGFRLVMLTPAYFGFVSSTTYSLTSTQLYITLHESKPEYPDRST